jgi:hypothetical protein
METSKGLELHLICSDIEDIGLENNFGLFPVWANATASRVELYALKLKNSEWECWKALLLRACS